MDLEFSSDGVLGDVHGAECVYFEDGEDDDDKALTETDDVAGIAEARWDACKV